MVLYKKSTRHSVIERHIRHLDIYSPLSLIKVLLKIPQGKLKLRILQMKARDFYNFAIKLGNLDHSKVPYTKIKHIVYNKKNVFNLEFKLSFDDAHFNSVDIVKEYKNRTQQNQNVRSAKFPVIQKMKDKGVHRTFFWGGWQKFDVKFL